MPRPWAWRTALRLEARVAPAGGTIARDAAGSRFDKAGIAISYVSKLLGHASLAMTTRYFTTTRRELHRVMDQFGAHRAENSAEILLTGADDAQSVVSQPEQTSPSKFRPDQE